jgi:hypothetical protein
LPNCDRCGKYISGLIANRYNDYCYECYRKWLRERTPIFLFAGRAGKKGARIPIPHLAFLKSPLQKREKEDEEKRKMFLTCNVCGHFSLKINSISKDVYSNSYRIITKCPKCKDYEIRNLSKEELGKLDLDIHK